VPDDQETAHRDAEGREPLREAPTTELPRHGAGQCHNRPVRECRDQSEPEECVPEGDPIEPRHRHGEGRLVHVTESGWREASRKYSYIPVVAVERGHGEEQCDRPHRDAEHRPRREW